MEATATGNRTVTGFSLARARRAAGLSQQQVANRLGITRQAIGHYEAEAYPPRRAVIRIIAAIESLSRTESGS